MRYHYEKPSLYLLMYGEQYICDHPIYNICTLFRIRDRGLAVIQQRFDTKRKCTYWTEIDSWLTDAIYVHPKFKLYFDEKADFCKDALYPTVTVRQIMWALHMKPLKKEYWETVFDRQDI